jgi:hypothetical protein
MSSGGDARRSDNVYPYVASLTQVRLASMESHAHADSDARWPPVRGQRSLSGVRCGEGITRARKGKKEAIALVVDFGAPVRSNCSAKHLALQGEHLPIALSYLLQKPCRAVDISEEEVDTPPAEAGRCSGYVCPNGLR